MILSTQILQKIITELDFSRDLSAVLGIKQSSVEATAKRALQKKNRPFSLSRPEAVKFYKDSGIPEEEIFEQPAKP